MSDQYQGPPRGLDAKSFLKKVMERPVMYVGTNRLDYVEHLYSGYMINYDHSDSQPPWYMNYEMQYWLLHTQGVVLQNAEWGGLDLFYRYFGTSDTAIDQFSKMLHADIPPPQFHAHFSFLDDSVASEICQFHMDMWNNGDDTEPTAEEIKAEFFKTIRTLLAQQDEEYDEVRVYICDVGLCTQFRFVYRTPGGWRDDASMLADSKNHAQMVRLHRLIHDCGYSDIQFSRMNSQESAVYFHFFGDSPEWDVVDIAHEIRDEETLWRQYCKWKTEITASYE